MFLRRGGLQVLGGFVDSCGDAFDYLRHLGNLGVGFFPLFLIHILADRPLPAWRCNRCTHRARKVWFLNHGRSGRPFSFRNKRGIRSRSALTGSSGLRRKRRSIVRLQSRERLRIALGPLLEKFNGVFHRREIHERRHRLGGRRHVGFVRVRGGGEHAFLQFQVALGSFVLLVLQ